MTKITKTGTKDFFYVWDPNLTGASGYGAFQTFSYSNGNYYPTPGGGSYPSSSTGYNYIQSGSAFYIQGGTTDGTVSITENSKAGSSSAGSTLVFRPASGSTTTAQIRTNLYAIEANGSASLV